MAEIEDKRKELKDKFDEKKHPYLTDTQIEWLTDRLDYFDLGVEMARKEFLDILKKELNNYCLINMKYNIDVTDSMKVIMHNIKESLGVKE